MTETFIALADTDEWQAFWADNKEAIIDEIGDEATCYGLACNQALVIGGGAAPLFRIGFIDE